MTNSLLNKYQWATKRLKEEFPDCEVRWEIYDWGATLVVAVMNREATLGQAITLHTKKNVGGVLKTCHDPEDDYVWSYYEGGKAVDVPLSPNGLEEILKDSVWDKFRIKENLSCANPG